MLNQNFIKSAAYLLYGGDTKMRSLVYSGFHLGATRRGEPLAGWGLFA